jgi:hypothetical protein
VFQHALLAYSPTKQSDYSFASDYLAKKNTELICLVLIYWLCHPVYLVPVTVSAAIDTDHMHVTIILHSQVQRRLPRWIVCHGNLILLFLSDQVLSPSIPRRSQTPFSQPPPIEIVRWSPEGDQVEVTSGTFASRLPVRYTE